jgi:cation:H+ antiporter
MFDKHLLWAGVVTMISVIYLLYTLRNQQLSPMRLVYAGSFYALFASIFIVY